MSPSRRFTGGRGLALQALNAHQLQLALEGIVPNLAAGAAGFGAGVSRSFSKSSSQRVGSDRLFMHHIEVPQPRTTQAPDDSTLEAPLNPS